MARVEIPLLGGSVLVVDAKKTPQKLKFYFGVVSRLIGGFPNPRGTFRGVDNNVLPPGIVKEVTLPFSKKKDQK